METFALVAVKKPLILFKSYYVVWKPVGGAMTQIQLFEFKSYYVVWKLLRCLREEEYRLSLNRTM